MLISTAEYSMLGNVLKILLFRETYSKKRPDALSAVEHRPADVVPQLLIVEYELANRLWDLVVLPPALEPPCALALFFRRGSTCGLDRIGGRTQPVRGDCSWPAAYAACRASPRRRLPAAIVWPPAERAWVIMTLPRAQAWACSIARRGRVSSG